MKKIMLSLLLLAGVSSHQAGAMTDAQLKAQQDSLSMAVGKIYAASLNKMYAQNPKASKADFLESFDLLMKADTTRKSYMEGFEVALNLYNQIKQTKAQSGIELNRDVIVSQFKQSLSETIVSDDALGAMSMDVQSRMEVIEKELANRLIAPNEKAGADYIAKLLKTDKKFKKAASGLVYKIVTPGVGATFADTATVNLTYVGKHVDGTIFDQSQDTIPMQLNRVVAGFKEALCLMNPGCEMIAVMPANLAYGAKGAGKDRRTGKYAIEPGETLVFEIKAIGEPGKAVAPAVEVSKRGKVRAKDANYKGTGQLPPKGKKK